MNDLSTLERLIKLNTQIETLVEERKEMTRAIELPIKIIKVYAGSMAAIANGVDNPQLVAQRTIDIVQTLIN